MDISLFSVLLYISALMQTQQTTAKCTQQFDGKSLTFSRILTSLGNRDGSSPSSVQSLC